ncbi:hypothetical protein GF351_00475 [Candidatus Woesearchaeota archaeon]|nr:hypothetical protein [Candidatus Woesearchaeota archaeon]
MVIQVREKPKTYLHEGTYISSQAVQGKALIHPGKWDKIEPGTLVVLQSAGCSERADITWFSLLEQAAGVILQQDTPQGHLHQMLKEAGKPTLCGYRDADKELKDGDKLTMYPTRNSRGAVSAENPEFFEAEEPRPELPKIKTLVYPVCSHEKRVAALRHLPISGIGLMRSEFLNNYTFGVHPKAVIAYAKGCLRDPDTAELMDTVFHKKYDCRSSDPRDFYVDTVSDRIMRISDSLPEHSRRINYRLVDLRTDDSRALIGGSEFEDHEANPMMGCRGTMKLISEDYRDAFELECEVVKAALNKGADLHILTPLCRTPEEGRKLVTLVRNNCVEAEMGMMVEVPANAFYSSEFADIFDFFLTGPMDLTQAMFMYDREAETAARYTDPDNKATRGIVATFLSRIKDREKDVFIGEFEVLKVLREYRNIAGRNRIHLVSLPDRLEEVIPKIKSFEAGLSIDEITERVL